MDKMNHLEHVNPFFPITLYYLITSKVWGRSTLWWHRCYLCIPEHRHSFIKTDMTTVRAKYSVFEQKRYSPWELARPLVTNWLYWIFSNTGRTENWLYWDGHRFWDVNRQSPSTILLPATPSVDLQKTSSICHDISSDNKTNLYQKCSNGLTAMEFGRHFTKFSNT